MATFDYYLGDFTPPLYWYTHAPPQLPPPANPTLWNSPFSPVGSQNVFEWVYAGFYILDGEGGAIQPKPDWWEAEMTISWPEIQPPPSYAYNNLVACAGQAYDPAFPSGGLGYGNQQAWPDQIGYGWYGFTAQVDFPYTICIFWPRLLGERPSYNGPYVSLLPNLISLGALLLPMLLGTSLDAAASVARRQYRNS